MLDFFIWQGVCLQSETWAHLGAWRGNDSVDFKRWTAMTWKRIVLPMGCFWSSLFTKHRNAHVCLICCDVQYSGIVLAGIFCVCVGGGLSQHFHSVLSSWRQEGRSYCTRQATPLHTPLKAFDLCIHMVTFFSGFWLISLLSDISSYNLPFVHVSFYLSVISTFVCSAFFHPLLSSFLTVYTCDSLCAFFSCLVIPSQLPPLLLLSLLICLHLLYTSQQASFPLSFLSFSKRTLPLLVHSQRLSSVL